MGGMSAGSLDDGDEDGAESGDKTFDGYHHENQTHKAHHDIVAGLAENLDKTGGCTEDEIGDEVDDGDGREEDELHAPVGSGVHEHDAVGDGSGAAEHGDGEGGDGNVVGVGGDFLVGQLCVGVARLKHVESDLEDDEAGGDAESVGGDAEEGEQELPADGESQKGDKGYDGGAADDACAFLLSHTLGHGEENWHGAEGIGESEEGRDAHECESDKRGVHSCKNVYVTDCKG